MIYCDSYLSLNHTVLRDNRGIRGGDKRGKGVEMRGNGGEVGVGVMRGDYLGYGTQMLGGGFLKVWTSKGRGGSLVLRTMDEFIIYYFT